MLGEKSYLINELIKYACKYLILISNSIKLNFYILFCSAILWIN